MSAIIAANSEPPPEMRDADEILIFGAGNIGRSFVGQIFARAGYRVIFADLDRELVARLREAGRYEVVHRYPDGREDRLTVEGVTAIEADRSRALAPVLSRVPLVATSVGAAALPHLLPLLTAEAVRRAEAGERRFDLILAENIHGGGELVRGAMIAALRARGFRAAYATTSPRGASPGVIECSVGKMVPIVPAERRAREPLTVYAESFNTLIVDEMGWVGPIPVVGDLRAVDPIAAWVDRKLFIHNLGHAACAYFAAERRGELTYIWQAVADRAIRERSRAAMARSAAALEAEYPGVFSPHDLEEHIDDLLHRFSSRSLGDTIFRVGRDVVRKLGPSDRIVGAIALLRRHGMDAAPVEEVYRAALHFDGRDEAGEPFPADRAFRRRLQEHSDPILVLAEVSGFDPKIDRALLQRLLDA